MIMKKVFNSLFVIIAAMVTFAGCAKQETDAPATSETKTVQFFANSIETKTEFGTPDNGVYPTLWSAGDKVKILVNLEEVKNTEKTAEVECSDDYKSASFTSDLAQPEAETFTFYSVSPSTALLGKTAEKLYVNIPSDQTPLATSVDKTAQLLYAASETTTEMPSSVELAYQHLTAYGRFTLANLDEESVSSIKLEADFDIAGKWDYFIEDESFVVRSDKGSKSITITTQNTTDIWFACAPVDVTGKTMTLTVTTEKSNFVKVLNFPADKERKFEAGKISKFTVDMTGITAGGSEEPEQPGETTEAWTLVTDASTLSVGDEIIIVAPEDNYALGPQANNNRTGKGITKSGNTVEISDEIQVIELQAGNKSNTFAFYTNTGYLYAASSGSNHLKTKTTLDDNGSWSISVASNGVATVNANGTNSRNTMRYNPNNGSPIFSCYASTQTLGTLVSIYKRVSGSETPEPEQKYLTVSQSVFNVTADQTSVTFDVNANVGWGLDESEGVDTQIVGISDDELVMTVEVTFPANETAEPKTHTVTFIPEELDENVTVTINQAAKVAVDTNFEAGDYWIIGVEDEISHVMVPFASTSNYAYAPSEVITDNRTFAKYAFTFEAVEGGFNIKASDERYYSTDANYKNFQIKDTPSVWTVSVQNDGTYLITDASTGKTIKYGDSTYTTFGVYASSDTNTGVYPILVKADNPLPVELTSISVTGCTTIFNEGDPFVFDGIVTANYNDGSTKDVTNSAVVTEPNMVNGAEVTVSYTEGTVTKTFNYNITVKAASQGGGDVVTGGSETFDLRYSATDVKSADWSISQNNVSLYWSKGTASNTPSPNKEGSVRMYTNTTLTIAAPQGTKISRVVFTTMSTGYSATNLKYNGSKLTSEDWTLSVPENTIVLTASANVRIKEIVVYYN